LVNGIKSRGGIVAVRDAEWEAEMLPPVLTSPLDRSKMRSGKSKRYFIPKPP
jgi:hypothetical protein